MVHGDAGVHAHAQVALGSDEVAVAEHRVHRVNGRPHGGYQ